MKESISRPDAATGTTTERAYNPISKAERIKQRAEYIIKINTLKQKVEETVRPLTEICFKLESDVNRITDAERGFSQITETPNFIVKNYSF